MESVKGLCGTLAGHKPLIVERIRGYVLVEGKDEDYELNLTFNELTLKPMKNKDKRLAPGQLGLLVYGRNVTNDPETSTETSVQEVMACGRTLLPKKLPLRTPESVTAAELEVLCDRFVSQHLPYGFFYSGYGYVDLDGKNHEHHPDQQKLKEVFCEEENAKISAYNEQVQKERDMDYETYMVDGADKTCKSEERPETAST